MRLHILSVLQSAAILMGGISTAYAGDSAQNASDASAHASKAVVMGVAASGQAALGVAAVPMLSVGAFGGAVAAGSSEAGKASAAAAAGSASHHPLPITDATITVTPPSEALKRRTATTPR